MIFVPTAVVQLRVVQKGHDNLEFDLPGTWDEQRQAQVEPVSDLEVENIRSFGEFLSVNDVAILRSI